MAIRLIVADDHEVVRTGLGSLLEGTGIEIVGEATDGTAAIKKACELVPDVVLMDIRMLAGDGLSALEKLREKLPDVAVVMLSTYDNPTYVARSLALGAHDYVLKGSSREELVDAIERAARGEQPSEGSIAHPVKNAMDKRQNPEDKSIPLTKREMQVLRHLALGLSNREIGASLTISVETVKEHVQNILRKLQVTDRTQAAVWAVKRGLA